MLKTIMENIIKILELGFVTSVSGIAISSYYNKKQTQREIKRLIIKKAYKKLNSVYSDVVDNMKNNIHTTTTATDFSTNNLIEMYQHTDERLKELKGIYLKAKYVFDKKDTEEIDSKLKDIDKIGMTLYCSALHYKLKEKKDYDNIIKNGEIEIIEEDKIQEHMRKYIDKTDEFNNFFSNLVENKLRKLLS